jgi:hypothetical protein
MFAPFRIMYSVDVIPIRQRTYSGTVKLMVHDFAMYIHHYDLTKAVMTTQNALLIGYVGKSRV